MVPEGAYVSAGDLIGYMGSTGTASVHTHFNVSYLGDWFDDVDPFDLLYATSPTACGGAPPDTTPPPPPPPADGCGVLAPGEALGGGASEWSCDGRFELVMQTDGNFVVYDAWGSPLWNSETAGHDGAWLAVQDDGNVVVYDAWGAPLWDTGTWGH